eukprot:1144903-Pelagomonas_calceolata.AAC.2
MISGSGVQASGFKRTAVVRQGSKAARRLAYARRGYRAGPFGAHPVDLPCPRATKEGHPSKKAEDFVSLQEVQALAHDRFVLLWIDPVVLGAPWFYSLAPWAEHHCEGPGAFLPHSLQGSVTNTACLLRQLYCGNPYFMSLSRMALAQAWCAPNRNRKLSSFLRKGRSPALTDQSSTS